MTDLATSIDSAPLSTTIDTDAAPSASGAGMPNVLPADDKPLSLRDTVAAAVKETETPAEKPEVEEKPKAEEKPEKPRDLTGKFAANEKPAETEAKGKEGEDSAQVAKEPEAGTGQDKTAQERPSEGKRYPEPPARFLPDSKDVWRNVPRPVQRDIEVMARQYTEELERHKAATERYEPIRQYDELARQNGGDLGQSLQRVVAIERAMQENPIAGLQMVVQQAGLRASLYDIAQHIVNQGPQALQQTVQNAQHSQSQSEVQQLQQRIAQMEQDRAGEQLAAQIITPFAQDHPRYYELQDDIALFLQSGRIPASLSPAERLEAAYVMAERINPPSHDSADTMPDPEPENRAAPSLNGLKSIKSAPGAISEDLEEESGGSIREVLEDVVRKQLRRA